MARATTHAASAGLSRVGARAESSPTTGRVLMRTIRSMFRQPATRWLPEGRSRQIRGFGSHRPWIPLLGWLGDGTGDFVTRDLSTSPGICVPHGQRAGFFRPGDLRRRELRHLAASGPAPAGQSISPGQWISPGQVISRCRGVPRSASPGRCARWRRSRRTRSASGTRGRPCSGRRGSSRRSR
jgi:hypothetical protein